LAENSRIGALSDWRDRPAKDDAFGKAFGSVLPSGFHLMAKRKRIGCSLKASMLIASVLALTAVVVMAAPAQAGPPAYLILRRAESPGKFHRPGHTDAALYDTRTSGYAYGYFGVAPRAHASRHFGFYRTYTQWSTY
jgi:hypothetical protein